MEHSQRLKIIKKSNECEVISLTNLTRGSEKIPALSVLNERQKMDNKIKKIRELNDNLRQNFSGGMVMLTRGVADLIPATPNFFTFRQER